MNNHVRRAAALLAFSLGVGTGADITAAAAARAQGPARNHQAAQQKGSRGEAAPARRETAEERAARRQIQSRYDRMDRLFLAGDLIGLHALGLETTAPVVTMVPPGGGGKPVTLRRDQMAAESERRILRGESASPPHSRALSQKTTVERVELRKGGAEAVALVRQRAVDLKPLPGQPAGAPARRVTNLALWRETCVRAPGSGGGGGAWQTQRVEVLRDDYYEGGKLVFSAGRPVKPAEPVKP